MRTRTLVRPGSLAFVAVMLLGVWCFSGLLAPAWGQAPSSNKSASKPGKGFTAAAPATEAPATEAPATEAPDDEPPLDPRLHAIGALSASNLYITFGFIGTVADAFGQNVYDADKARRFLVEAKSLSALSAEELRKVGQMPLTDADRQSINEMSEIYDLLVRDVDLLIKYTETKAQADAQKFSKLHHDEIFPKIKKVLGIQ